MRTNIHLLRFAAVVCIPVALAAEVTPIPPNELPALATATLARSLTAAGHHTRHLWRDTPSIAADGTVNAYVEIPRGERRKWEFDMRANRRGLDRVIPPAVGGYPVNYGFVPQTISYDGDPFDVLVLGPPLPGGRIVGGVIVGLMLMEDEKGLDAKVVVSPVAKDGRPLYKLTADEQRRIGGYFQVYKDWEPGKFSRVPGWGSAEDGHAYLDMSRAFFHQCQSARNGPCVIKE